MVRFGNSFVIFTTSKKNSNEIKDVLVKNFGLNLSVPKDNSRYINKEDDLTDEDEIGNNSGEKNPLIETRDQVPPLLHNQSSQSLHRKIDTPRNRKSY